MIKELKIKQILLHGEAKADRNNKFKSQVSGKKNKKAKISTCCCQAQLK